MKNPFESQTFEEKPFLDTAHERALKALEESTIDVDKFENYGADNIKKDKEYVEEMEKKFAASNTPEEIEQKKLADILEAILLERMELDDWLGENVETYKTSKYDDFVNKIDAIVEFREEERRASHMGLGIDVTFGNDVERKMEKIKKEIDEGKMGNIKYFNSDHMGYSGALREIPKVIVGIDRKKTLELMDAWLAKDKKKMSELPVKNIIIKEILVQLAAFKNYAASKNQKVIASRYSQVEKQIQAAIGKAKPTDDDRVLESIEKYTNKLS